MRNFSPFLLWKYGRKIRMSSKNAHKPQQHQIRSKVDVEESQTTSSKQEEHA